MGSCTRGTEGTCEVRRGWRFGSGAGHPGLTLFPTVSRPSKATFVCCMCCGGWNCRWLMLLGSGPGGGTCRGRSHRKAVGGQGEAARTEGGQAEAHAAPTCPQPQDLVLAPPGTQNSLGQRHPSLSSSWAFAPPLEGPNSLILPILQRPSASASKEPPCPLPWECPGSEGAPPPKATHSGVQGPLHHPVVARFPLGASGQHRQELVPLRPQMSSWHQSIAAPPAVLQVLSQLPRGRTPGPGVRPPSTPSGSAYMRVGHGEEVGPGDTLAGQEDLERGPQKHVSPAEAAAPGS